MIHKVSAELEGRLLTEIYPLRYNQYNRIKNLLLGRQESVGATMQDNRIFIDAVLYRYRAEIP